MEIYTDGGCSGNPGPGGWAYVVVENGEKAAENWGADASTTNNRMELMGAISALKSLDLRFSQSSLTERTSIKIYTDSQYVQKGISIWIKDWKARGWRTADKKPVKNQDLWQTLDGLVSQFGKHGYDFDFVWVKGHAGNLWNERCDELTQTAIASLRGDT